MNLSENFRKDALGSSDATDRYRDVVSDFLKGLNLKSAIYLYAKQIPGDEAVNLCVEVDSMEVGKPASSKIADLQSFEDNFKKAHRDALDLLPANFKLRLTLLISGTKAVWDFYL